MASVLITTDELARLTADGAVTILDVRGTAAYLKGHIPGAVSTRWQDFTDPEGAVKGLLHPDSAFLAAHFSALGVANEAPVVVYSEPFECWGAEGRFFWMLHFLGHTDVRVMDGGFPTWRRQKRPIAHLPTRPREGNFVPLIQAQCLIDRQGVAERAGEHPGSVVVDCRGSEEYRDEGHVPGAVNLPWLTLYREDGTVKPEAELRALLAAVGVTPDLEVVPYCTGGVRSAWVFFVLHLLGYPQVRNYDGSWWEWSADPDAPIER